MTRADPTSAADVLARPAAVASWLSAGSGLVGVIEVEVKTATRRQATFWVTLAPWAAPAAEGYPLEIVAITVFRSGRIAAVPVDADRRAWHHRYLFQLGSLDDLGELCLWDPSDPRNVRWEWSDGLAAFVTIVHRHVQAEECWRRTGSWPAEDAPHGQGPHPVRTWATQRAAGAAA